MGYRDGQESCCFGQSELGVVRREDQGLKTLKAAVTVTCLLEVPVQVTLHYSARTSGWLLIGAGLPPLSVFILFHLF